MIKVKIIYNEQRGVFICLFEEKYKEQSGWYHFDYNRKGVVSYD